jgi:hypothetical protein
VIEIAAVGFVDSVIDWLWICGGVAISVVLPILSVLVKANFGKASAADHDFGKYLALAAFCAVTAVLVLAIYRSVKPDDEILWYAALLAGYGWEATLEKVILGPPT